MFSLFQGSALMRKRTSPVSWLRSLRRSFMRTPESRDTRCVRVEQLECRYVLNAAPIANYDGVSPTYIQIEKNTPTVIDVLANDTDADHDPLHIAQAIVFVRSTAQYF
jgi:cadherin-like protein